jgi:hypothetical protein
MNPGDLCICGHTREVHFGHECSVVNCRCKQFVLIDLAVELFDSLEAVLPYLPDQNDAKNYAAGNEGRASSFQVAAIRARKLVWRAKNS